MTLNYDDIMGRAEERATTRSQAANDRRQTRIPEAEWQKAVRRQRAALTRAEKVGEPRSEERRKAVVLACAKTVREWEESGWHWPDDWSRWQRALDDAFPVFHGPNLEDLR